MDKYIVWKLSEIVQVTTPEDLQKLDTIVDRVLHLRQAEGKNPVNSYIVVSEDDPYYKVVKEIVKSYKGSE